MEQFRLVRQIRDDPALRGSFDALAGEVFGLSFGQWQADGYWTDRFLPYVLAEGETVVSAAAANLIDLRWEGAVRRCLQIGTLMTAPSYRGRGLARRLMGEILRDWADQSQLVYLFAPPKTAAFYSSLGFVRRQEMRCFAQVSSPAAGMKIPLTLEDLDTRSLLWSHSLEGNPFAALTGRGCYELLLFHAARRPGIQFYYLPQADTVAAVEHRADRTVCLDLFGGGGDLKTILPLLADRPGELELGFLPSDSSACRLAPLEGEDDLFLLPAAGVAQLPEGPLRIPPLTRI